MEEATTTTVLLIRHGQTDWNLQRRWQGHEDVPLNGAGREQARRLARRIGGWPIQALYSSDLARAAGTARILGAALGLEPQLLPDWRELHVGHFQGLTRAEINTRFPELGARMDHERIEMPGGETWAALSRRAVAAYEAILQRHPGEMAAVVSHGGVLHAVVQHVLGLPPERPNPLTLRGNTGLTIVELRPPQRAVLTRLNDTAHLEVEGGSW